MTEDAVRKAVSRALRKLDANRTKLSGFEFFFKKKG